jgi:radical SAM superfamily enzyme YgiQ (UPF0313 family)
MKILYLPNSNSQQRQLEKPVAIYPVQMAMEAQFYRENGHEVHWNNGSGKYDKIISHPERLDFLSLPIPDRNWTNAFDKRYQRYGNYKHHPATHMLSAIGCWHGRCTFCIEDGKEWIVRPVESSIQEVTLCNRLGFKEVFDDSATFPQGKWMEDFCVKKSASEGLRKMYFGCNMRIDGRVDWKMMAHAGFRMVLFGIESANQATLDKIHKGGKVEEIIPTLKKASESGLEPHGTFMFGYPWESEAEELKTLELCRFLLRKGYLRTAQASVYSPPCTPPDPKSKGHRFTKRIYEAGFYPDFCINQLRNIRNRQDLVYIAKGIRKAVVHD